MKVKELNELVKRLMASGFENETVAVFERRTEGSPTLWRVLDPVLVVRDIEGSEDVNFGSTIEVKFESEI